jgi:hypothetical protein
MSKQKVTPGPWGVGGVSDPRGPRPTTSVYGQREPNMQSGPLVCRGMSVADGYLIAAAPELLGLARAYAGACAECGGGAELIDSRDNAYPCPECAAIRAVIDKAEGREGVSFFDEEVVTR